jgi:hypothetical protein
LNKLCFFASSISSEQQRLLVARLSLLALMRHLKASAQHP